MLPCFHAHRFLLLYSLQAYPIIQLNFHVNYCPAAHLPHATIEMHPLFSEAPRLSTSVRDPQTDSEWTEKAQPDVSETRGLGLGIQKKNMWQDKNDIPTILA